jgi:tripartite-type tricarboxylate transporter receptor subunit TctC
MRSPIVAALAALSICFVQTALGKDWPERTIRVIVPFGAGSLADLVPRIIFDRVSQRIHQPIIIENRPGAGGMLGAAAVAASSPDGYTLLANSNAQVTAPLLYTNFSHRAHDFTAVALLVTYPDALIIAPSKHLATLDQFVHAAKAHKGGLTFAAFGIGSAAYMNAERFRLRAGFDAIQVPFKGAPAAILEVMVGRVDYCFCGVGTSLPLIRQGRLTALAVGTQRRSPLLPDVPTTVEAGYSDSDYTPWIGLFAPARTPQAIIVRLHDEVVAALKERSVHDKLTALGTDPALMSISEFTAFVEQDAALNKRLVKALGLKPH